MQIYGPGNGPSAILSLSQLFGRRAESPAAAASREDARRRRLVGAYRQVMRLQAALTKLEPALFRRSREIIGFSAGVTSSSPLGDLATGTPTVVRSTGEINATPTSFSPRGPDWVGSTAAASIGGIYDGSSGTGALTFEVTRAGVHGEDQINIAVRDGGGATLETITVGRNDPLDQSYTLANGLTFTLGAGEVVLGDRFTVDVDASDPTAYTPTAPAWQGSTAQAIMGGVYDGSNGDSTLVVRVNRGGTRGVDDIQLKIEDAQGTGLETITVGRNDPLDTEYTLSTGLTFTLGAGTVLKDTTFAVDVSATIGSAVDPDNPFDGVGNDDPGFENGATVTAGAFEVNGVTIDVFSGDSINSVLARITQSAAGVVASFDANTETVLLTHETTGASGTITIANDTSGFVAATKLAGATSTPGTDDEAGTPLDQVSRFDAVTSGTLTVNGVDIGIDTSTDSLRDILARIGASGTGVSATFDADLQHVSILSQDGSPLELDSGGTGFFPALLIADGTYDPALGSAREGAIPRSRRDAIVSALKDAADALNALFGDELGGLRRVGTLRDAVQHAVSRSFDADGQRFRSEVGIHFDFRRSAADVFDFSLSKRRQVRSALASQSGVDEMRDLFFGRGTSTKGLVERLRELTREMELDLERELGSEGILVDVIV